MKQQILNRLNELIVEEKGVPVTMDSKWSDTELDSLGTVIVIAILESEYPFFKNLPDDADALSSLDFPNLTIRELIRKCVLANLNTSQQQNDETGS